MIIANLQNRGNYHLQTANKKVAIPPEVLDIICNLFRTVQSQQRTIELLVKRETGCHRPVTVPLNIIMKGGEL